MEVVSEGEITRCCGFSNLLLGASPSHEWCVHPVRSSSPILERVARWRRL